MHTTAGAIVGASDEKLALFKPARCLLRKSRTFCQSVLLNTALCASFVVRFCFGIRVVAVFQIIVPSAITSGDTTDYQTFNVGVHTSSIRLIPKFRQTNQWVNIKEVRFFAMCFWCFMLVVMAYDAYTG